jgi:hypothetical protein
MLMNTMNFNELTVPVRFELCSKIYAHVWLMYGKIYVHVPFSLAVSWMIWMANHEWLYDLFTSSSM